MYTSFCSFFQGLAMTYTDISSITIGNVTASPSQILLTAVARNAMTAVYSILLVASLIGNSFVIAAVYRDRGLRSTVNVLIANMSLSDLTIPIVALPVKLKILYLGREWLSGILGVILCKLASFVQDVSFAVSILSMVAIAVERFFKVVSPTKSPPITSKNCHWLVALIWVAATACHSFYFYTKQLRIINGVSHCVTTWEPAIDDFEALKIQNMVFLICLAVLPFTLLVTIYAFTLTVLNRQRKLFHLESEEMRRKDQRDRRITLMLFTVSAIFIAVWVPFWLYLFLHDYQLLNEAQMRVFYPVAVVLPFSFSALNPLVYFIFSEDFRRAFQNLLCCRCQCSPEVGSSLVVQTPTSSNGVVVLDPEEEIHLNNLIEGALS